MDVLETNITWDEDFLFAPHAQVLIQLLETEPRLSPRVFHLIFLHLANRGMAEYRLDVIYSYFDSCQFF